MPIGAEATGIANIAMDGTVLDTWYPSPALIDATPTQHPATQSAAALVVLLSVIHI